MAFKKFGAATVKQSRVSFGDWGSVRRQAGLKAEVNIDNRVLRLGKFNPEQFLLSHATIISSVDVESNGFYITPKTSKYINSNADSWERDLLLATYQTFAGAENYLEHVQIPSLSKGKILDAVARDLGDTVYVDILVATNKKHRDLIAKIDSNELTGLSMGAHVAFTTCTRCGNKAADETELCQCLLYGKGDLFIDESGVERKVAELCGHKDDPSSNIFIEASWVKSPAFAGAVKRGIIHSLDAEAIATAMQREGAKVYVLQNTMAKAASLAQEEETVLLEDEPMPDTEEPRDVEDLKPNQNDNLILQNKHAFLKEARKMFSSLAKISDEALFKYQKIIAVGSRKGWEALTGEITQRQLLTAVVLSDRNKGHKGLTPRLAKVLEATGPFALYSSEQTFFERCSGLLDRPLVQAEKELLRKYGGLIGKFPEGKQLVTV